MANYNGINGNPRSKLMKDMMSQSMLHIAVRAMVHQALIRLKLVMASLNQLELIIWTGRPILSHSSFLLFDYVLRWLFCVRSERRMVGIPQRKGPRHPRKAVAVPTKVSSSQAPIPNPFNTREWKKNFMMKEGIAHKGKTSYSRSNRKSRVSNVVIVEVGKV
jgi:hypothetical protein